MKLSRLFTINAIVLLLFGLGFALAPAATLAPYGVTLDAYGLQIARLFGAAVLGYAVLTWSARNTEESGARRAIILSLFLGHAIGFVVALINQLSGLVNALGWSTVALYLLLALGYGYFQFNKPDTATE